MAGTLGSAVVETPYPAGTGLPLFVQPRDSTAAAYAAFLEWYGDHVDRLDALVSKVGAVVLRGFCVNGTDGFRSVISHYNAAPLGYTGGASARRELAPGVYASTDVPPDVLIMLHQEMAYLPTYPNRVAFFCAVPPVSGGETLLADMRQVTSRLPEGLLDAVEERGVAEIRNLRDLEVPVGDPYLDRVHTSWQRAFSADDRAQVDEACRNLRLDHEWLGDGSVSVVYRGPGFVKDPCGGGMVWFNMMAAHTICADSVGDRFALYASHYGAGRPFPFEVTYGDGAPIEAEYLRQLYAALRACTVGLAWSAGDVLIVDNRLVAHGRNTYRGVRDVRVALLDEGSRVGARTR